MLWIEGLCLVYDKPHRIITAKAAIDIPLLNRFSEFDAFKESRGSGCRPGRFDNGAVVRVIGRRSPGTKESRKANVSCWHRTNETAAFEWVLKKKQNDNPPSGCFFVQHTYRPRTRFVDLESLLDSGNKG